MQYGPGWIIFEESYRHGTRMLLSILAPRRTYRDVIAFMQQQYVDRHCSIEERLAYKKSRRASPFQVLKGQHVNPLTIGHEPFLIGLYAEQIALKGTTLEFIYKILVSIDEQLQPTFEKRRQTLMVPDT